MKHSQIARKLESHGPDDPDGYTERSINMLLTSDQREDFRKWMKHQTVKIHGSRMIFYTGDIMRWARGMERWRVENASSS